VLLAGVAGGLLHGHGGGIPGRLLGLLVLGLGGLEEAEETVFEHFFLFVCLFRVEIDRLKSVE
jgi:hypothetical protein